MKKLMKLKDKNKILIMILIMALTVISVISFLHTTGRISIFSTGNYASSVEEDREAQTTSSAPTAQSNYNEGDERQPGNSIHENRGSSVINDTQGNIPSDTPTNQPLSSKSGEITIYTPSKNTILETGHLISGVSSLQKVTYRIIDDTSGMIATGDLKVVNGKFSGTISFDTPSSEGRIDIFATRQDGSEYSTIEIPVRFR